MKSSEKSHKASMNNFDKEYNRTEKEVYKKTQKREKIASKTALSAVIPAVLLILFISAFLVEPINKAVKKSKIDSSKVKISEQIYSYLDNGDYVGLSKYSDSIDALDNNSFSEEYPVLMAARYYSWSQSFMNKQDNNYNLEEQDISGLSEYLSKFYYYSQISPYNFIRKYVLLSTLILSLFSFIAIIMQALTRTRSTIIMSIITIFFLIFM